VREVQEGLKAAVAAGGEQGARMAQEVVMDSGRLSFQPAPDASAVQPLSAEGPVKSFEA
jgi:SWI/SNF related-matrix-associated actin-dependent regulator of chromatin subfamily C